MKTREFIVLMLLILIVCSLAIEKVRQPRKAATYDVFFNCWNCRGESTQAIDLGRPIARMHAGCNQCGVVNVISDSLLLGLSSHPVFEGVAPPEYPVTVNVTGSSDPVTLPSQSQALNACGSVLPLNYHIHIGGKR